MIFDDEMRRAGVKVPLWVSHRNLLERFGPLGAAWQRLGRWEPPRSFVRTVKAATRRKYTPEEKIRIVLEGFRREVTVSDLCRREGIKPHSYYSWTKEFMEAGKERLTRDSVRDATRDEVHLLKRENGELKHLVADLSLEVYRLKKTSIPMPQGAGGIGG